MPAPLTPSSVIAGLALICGAGCTVVPPVEEVIVSSISRAVGGVVRDAVVVVEVADATDAVLAVVVVELVVARSRALQHLEGAPVLVERVLEVRVEAVLVLLVAEHRDQRRVHALDLHRRRILGGVARGRGGAAGADVARLLAALRAPGLAGDVADGGEHRRRARVVVGPVVVVTEPVTRVGEHDAAADRQCKREHSGEQRDPARSLEPPQWSRQSSSPSLGNGWRPQPKGRVSAGCDRGLSDLNVHIIGRRA